MLLSDKVEGLTGPDREIDVEIQRALVAKLVGLANFGSEQIGYCQPFRNLLYRQLRRSRLRAQPPSGIAKCDGNELTAKSDAAKTGNRKRSALQSRRAIMPTKLRGLARVTLYFLRLNYNLAGKVKVSYNSIACHVSDIRILLYRKVGRSTVASPYPHYLQHDISSRLTKRGLLTSTPRRTQLRVTSYPPN